MRAHSSLRLAPCVEPLPSFWPHRGIALGAFVWFGKRGSPTRRPLLSRNAGTAEPVRVSPPEAVAYPLELCSRWYPLVLSTLLFSFSIFHRPRPACATWATFCTLRR